ncbi:MAG TPA: peptide-methionine (S)-S-oxide reductase MsrA [Flavobacteriales bacterium]|nr:peptide-methionine (S)-S-oxide reductase MsrA [Flavobacteriales bacterium]
MTSRALLALPATAFLALLACSSNTSKPEDTAAVPEAAPTPVAQELSGYSVAYLASGCFWCVEEIYESVRGVKEAVSGYSGGDEQDPTYQQVGSGSTGHAETVAVYYDPEQISYREVLMVFFCSHDPTTPNRQGPDHGTQYRSAIFYTNAEERATAEALIKELDADGRFGAPIVTEVSAFKHFWPAEDYHQDYVVNNPDNSYVQNVSLPRCERFKSACPEFLK